MKEYNPLEIEPRWQAAWEESGINKVHEEDGRPKKYILEMFPYPSGDIHMGHARNYSIGDVIARYYRMKGFDVLHPMGWDAFGLPAENAAIKHHSHPAKWTYANIETQKASFKRMGFSYDWDRTVVACDPEYYRWGQWIFEKFWERGLVERRNSPVNWCPGCQTVLANEQVIEGRCWRCDSEIEKRDLTQWYLKITDYAQELLDDLDQLEGWPERVKQQQANWIGRSEGAEVDFTLCDKDGEPIEGDEGKITVFTTRADTLFGVSFFVLAPEYARLHELVEGTEYEEAVTKIVEDSKHISAVERAQGTLEKHGAFTGRYVVNPVNGEKVPVWVADYVVADYGTGAVMAVPCGDQRDFEFARKYDLPIVPIILDDDDRAAVEASGETIDTFHAENVDWDCAHAAEGTLVQSGKYTGMRGGKHSEGEAAIVADLEAMGCGRRKVEFRLRDWLISRQRFFGVPFPLWYPVKEDGTPDYDHPITPSEARLPIDPTDDVPEGYTEDQRDVPGGFTAEPDIMDTWATSSLTPQIVTRWEEPGEENQAIFNATFPMDLRPQGQDIIRTWLFSTMDRAHLENKCLPWANTTLSGWILDPDHKKMSKSKGNVVVPNEPIEKFGADAVRYWAAAARLGLDATYDIGQMKIGRRLAIKLLNATKFALAIGREDENHHVGAAAEAAWNPADVTEPLDRAAMAKLALVVRQATEALESYEHSKALEVIESYFWQFCDDYIELVKNRAYGTPDEHGNVPSEKAVKSARTALGLGLDAFARLLAPYLPYATEEVWSWMHAGSGSVHRAAWPVVDPYVEAATGASPELLTWAGKAVEQLRKIKSEAKVSMKTPILSVALSAASEGVEAIHAALGDIAQAGRVVGKFDLVAKHAEESAAEGTPETEVAVEASELGEPPAKKPKH